MGCCCLDGGDILPCISIENKSEGGSNVGSSENVGFKIDWKVVLGLIVLFGIGAFLVRRR